MNDDISYYSRAPEDKAACQPRALEWTTRKEVCQQPLEYDEGLLKTQTKKYKAKCTVFRLDCFGKACPTWSMTTERWAMLRRLAKRRSAAAARRIPSNAKGRASTTAVKWSPARNASTKASICMLQP